MEVRASSRRVKSQTGADSAIGKLAAAREQREARAQQQKDAQQQKEARGKDGGAAGVWDEEAELSSDDAPLDSEEEGMLDEGFTRERYDDASEDEVCGTESKAVVGSIADWKLWGP